MADIAAAGRINAPCGHSMRARGISSDASATRARMPCTHAVYACRVRMPCTHVAYACCHSMRARVDDASLLIRLACKAAAASSARPCGAATAGQRWRVPRAAL